MWTEVVDRRRKLWTVDGSCGPTEVISDAPATTPSA